MIDPGWAVAGCMLAVNIVGWVVNRSRVSKGEACREGKIIEAVDNLGHRVDRLEQRCDEYFSKH